MRNSSSLLILLCLCLGCLCLSVFCWGDEKPEDTDKALAEALEKGNIAQVKRDLSNVKDINAVLYDDQMPMHFAARSRSRETVLLLLSRGADINVRREDGLTPLIVAASCGLKDGAWIEFLVKQGADVNARDNRGMPSLMWALWAADVETITSLIHLGADTNVKTIYGGILSEVVVLNQELLPVIRLLLKSEKNINQRDERGRTPLLNALSRGHIQTAKLLMEKGADVNIADGQQFTPLMAAVRWDTEIVKLLLLHGAKCDVRDESGKTPFLIATAYGSVEILRLLLHKGSDINAVDKFGGTALMEAAAADRVENLDFLLKRRAKMTAEDQEGKTALYKAAYACAARAVHFLLVYGAADRNKESELNKALFAAMDTGGFGFHRKKPDPLDVEETVRLLLRSGANIHAVDEEDRTPLLYAIGKVAPSFDTYKSFYIGAFDALLRAGADINAHDRKGTSGLMLAALGGAPELIEYLLSHDANINLKDKQGRTALMVVASYPKERYRGLSLPKRENLVAAIKALLKHGADMNVRDNEGETALTLAEKVGFSDFVSLLRKAQ